MASRAELGTIDEVLGFYEQHKTPFFGIYVDMLVNKTKRRYFFEDDDMIKGRDILNEALHTLASNRSNTNTYTIAVFRKKGKGKQDPQFPEGFELENQITFKLNDASIQPYQPVIAGTDSRELAMIRAELAALKMQLAADDETEDDEDDEDDENNFLGNIFKDPTIQKNIAMGLMSLFNGNTGKVTNLAGIGDQDEKIRQAIEILRQADPELGDDLLRLAEIAENSPAQFKMLLNMLRK